MTMDNVRTEKEINDLIDKCADAAMNGTKFSGMSYEEGIRAGIEWVLGLSDEHPLED